MFLEAWRSAATTPWVELKGSLFIWGHRCLSVVPLSFRLVVLRISVILAGLFLTWLLVWRVLEYSVTVATSRLGGILAWVAMATPPRASALAPLE